MSCSSVLTWWSSPIEHWETHPSRPHAYSTHAVSHPIEQPLGLAVTVLAEEQDFQKSPPSLVTWTPSVPCCSAWTLSIHTYSLTTHCSQSSSFSTWGQKHFSFPMPSHFLHFKPFKSKACRWIVFLLVSLSVNSKGFGFSALLLPCP